MSPVEVHTRQGRRALASGPPPQVGESSTLQLSGLPSGASVMLGPLALEADPAGEVSLRLPRSDLSGHVGLLGVRVDGAPAGEIDIVPEKLTRTAYWRLRADLEAGWGRLAFDPTGVTAAAARGPSAADLWRRIAGSVEGIRRTPRTLLDRATAFGRLDQVRMAGSLRPGLLRAAVHGGVGEVDQIVPVVDVPENRLVRETLTRLERTARRQTDGRGVADAVAHYLREPPFTTVRRLSGPARPTHGMLRDPRYRVVYEALRALDGPISAVTEGPGELRLGLKALSRLYEYWVFLQVLAAAHRRFGPPVGAGYHAIARSFGGRRARLELPMGTTVEFPGRVRVAFEPQIWTTAADSWDQLELVPHPDPAQAARLATPDVVVAIGDAPPRLLVIDAKYVARAFVELEAAAVHTRYARMRWRSTPVVEHVLVAHPHAGLSADWAGYGHRPFVPGGPGVEVPWPARADLP